MKGNKINNILKQIGLSELERTCYLALLKKSPQKASQLAKYLELPKSTVLSVLYQLSGEFGIIKKTRIKNRFLFMVENVKDLEGFIKRREKEYRDLGEKVEGLLPELRSMQDYELEKPKIYYFEGKEGIKKIIEESYEEADEIIGYGSTAEEYRELPSLFPGYWKERVKKKIPVKVIVPATKEDVELLPDSEKKYLRNVHLIPEEFDFPVQFNIYKHTILITSFGEKFTLKIKSKPAAQALKKIFEYAFAYTEKSDKAIRESIKSSRLQK